MSGGKTIEAIAVGIGTRRSGRNLTLRLREHESDINELIAPTHPREWKSSLKESFKDPEALKILIEDIRRLDTELTKSINDKPLSYAASSPSLQSNILKYQEYVDVFVGIFAHFTSKDVEGDRILGALKSQKCPAEDIFSRLVVNPNYIVYEDTSAPDSHSDLNEMPDSEGKKIPLVQLARICDVSVLRFLGNVTEKTPPPAIQWALDYIFGMTKRIGDSLKDHSESGWYGLTFRKRKSTIRNSTTEVPKLALDGRPMVIAVGLPDDFVRPETGELGNNVPSISISDHEPALNQHHLNRNYSGSSIQSSLSESSIHIEVPSMEERKSPTPTLPELRTFGGSRSPIGIVLEEKDVGQQHGRQRRHSVATKPILSSSGNNVLLEVHNAEQSKQQQPKQRRVSIGSKPTGAGNIPVFNKPKRKTSIVEPVKAVIESIHEESVEEPSTTTITVPPRFTVSPPPPPQIPIPTTSTTPPSPPPQVQRAGLTSPDSLVSSLDRNVQRTIIPRPTSPLTQSLSRPISPPSEKSDDQSDSDTGPDPDVSVRYKPKPRDVHFNGPPHLPSYTTETLQTELHTLITHNGRISLLAILATISKLPSNPQLWTEDNWDACKVCISLIQFCVDFGLDTEKKNNMGDQSPLQRRRCVRSDPRVEKPSTTYSKLILKYSLKALIHCAVSTYTGCLIDRCRVNTCYSKNASQNLNKMMHQLERLYSNSPLLFRESIIEFTNSSPLKRIFHFLHVILQYCPRGSNRDPLDPSFSRRDTLIVLSATVLRIVVDRMMLLNLSEPFIQNSVIKEAIAFIHFSHTLFSQEFLRSKGFSHLQWYVNRVALSILLPMRGGASSSVPTFTIGSSNISLEELTETGTFPRRSGKKRTSSATPALDIGMPDEIQKQRKRGHTFHGPSFDGSQSPVPSHKSPSSSRKAKLVKQSSLHSDLDHTEASANTGSTNDHIIEALQKEWRGLHLGILHQRVRRLSIMMDLTEPGIIPDASLLASLIAVGPPGSLIPRVLVLLECALFVHKLNKEEMTVWMKNQPGRYLGNWELFKTLKGWGEAIGEALSACEITEKELFTKAAGADSDAISLAEEPIFNEEERDSEKRYIVNYSLKMVAVTLLIEITKFCREPPHSFLPNSPPSYPLKRSTSSQSQERKPSNISVMSSDSDTNPSPTPSFSHSQVRQGSLDYSRKGSSPLLDSATRFLSIDHPPSPNTGSRSVYLRVNSRHGKKHPRTNSYTIQNPGRPKSHLMQVEAPTDPFQVVAPNVPSKTTHRLSVSANAYLSQLNTAVDTHGASIRHRGGASSMSINNNAIRRKSMSSAALKSTNRRMNNSNNSPILSHFDGVSSRGSIQAATMTPPASQKLTSPQPVSRRPSMFGRVFQRGRRRRQNNTENTTGGPHRGRLSTTTNASSANSSPCLTRQKSAPQTRADTMYDSTLEDIKSNFPWLDVVEHMIVSFYSTSTEFQDKRKRSCCELMLALKHIFSMKFEKEDTGSTMPANQPAAASNDQATLTKTIDTSLSAAFTNATLLPDVSSPDKSSTNGTPRTMRSILRPKQVSSSEMPRSLAKLDFSGVRLRRFLESGMSWGLSMGGGDNVSLKDLLGDDKENLHTSIDYLLETDSSLSLDELMKAFNTERLQYVSTFFVGLLHAPFSLLTYAAPVLPPPTFRDLQESSWIALIDPDYEYADAAASFFLLCCVKEKEHMSNFLKSKAKTNHPVAVRDAVTRFEILWRCRDGVWSRMEQSAPKLFKLEEETGDTIGYSLPSQLLGIPGENLPYAPWKPVSVCSKDHAKENVQCYQGTKRAPLEHLQNIVKSTRAFPVSGSSVVQMEVDTAPAVVNSNALLELEYEREQGRYKLKDVYKLSTVFPNDLLPLIIMVIKALEPPYTFTSVLLKADSDTSIPTITQISSMAEHLLWSCMLDNPYYLFSPLLNQFNVLYKVVKDKKRKSKLTVEESAAEILEGILKPFHILLSHFSSLPPKASHMLFNNFIGIIMRHTEQPVLTSDIVIHSVLTLLKMVVPSMKGLTMKELKNQLKKESCYTTVLTTARIRGVEKIKIKWECQPDREVMDIAVQEENLKFIDLIHRENLSTEDEPEDSFSMWYSHYLTEEKTNRKVLNSLVVQDHYPATADGSTPVFILHKSTTTKQAMKDQQELLHIHKMTELARVMFTIQMMQTDSSATLGLQQEFAQPNPTFVISELQGLHSFPRKTLSSLLDEVGVAGLHEWQLRMVDIMLRGVWSKFILNLFIKVNDYQPSDNVILFLTVVNGSLLLQAEDSSTLRYCLATLLVAAKKFESIFRQNAYQMIIPMLLRVYSLHSRNKMVKDAIKFLWTCFYSLGKNTFLLQAVVSVANLFSQEVNSIASKMKVNYCPLCIDWQAEEQTTIVKSVVELIETLDCTAENLPPDRLDILGACPEETDPRTYQPWTGCSFEQVVPFCVTVASFNPEVLRGMQVLVFLDHLMVQLIKVYTTNKKNTFTQIATSIRSLIKGCESLKRSIKSTTSAFSSKGPQIQQQPSSNMDDNFDTLTNTRPRSSFIKEMFHKNRSGTSQSLQMPPRERSISELSSDEMGRARYIEGFRSRSLQNISQQIVTLSRDSLLSIAAQLITHAPIDDIKNPFDSASLMNICSITEKVLRIASKTNQDLLLESKGVAAVFNDLLPKVIWEQDNVSSFLLLVERLFKIFKKLQTEHSQTSSVPWTDLTKFIKCIQLCVYNSPILVTDNDQILSKIKGIMEICLSTSSTTTNKKRTTSYFIQDATPEFVVTFVELCTEMIVRTNGQSNKQRVSLSSLFANALDFKHGESSSVWEKMFLPLTINLGIRDSSCLSTPDISYVVENILNMSEHIRVVIERVKASSQKEQIRRYFISMKVILAAYCDNFTQEQWITIGYCFLASTSKFDKDSDNELYFEFCLEFLNFWETFIIPSRLPIFSILWHVVATIEGQMSLVLRNNSSLLEKLSGCLHRCKDILRSSSLFNVSLSKQELLTCLQQELQFNTSSFGDRNQRRSFASSFYPGGMPLELPTPRGSDLTTASTQQLTWTPSVSQPSTLKRKNSKAPGFPAIQETVEGDTSGLPSPDPLMVQKDSKAEETSTEIDKSPSIESMGPPATIRPTTLPFKPTPVEKTQKQETKKSSTTSSPKVTKPARPSVSFSDKISEQSPPTKKIFGSSFASKRSKTSSPIAEKQHVPAKKVYKPPKRNSERHRKPQSGFEADEEDASLETPKSSVSFPSSPFTAPNLSSITMKPSPLINKGESLVIAAEIHDEVNLSTSEDSNHSSEDTCLESSDNENDKATKTQTSLNAAKNKSPDLSRVTRATYRNSPSSARRGMFKASKNVQIEFEEQPDEETGQISHQRHREQPSDIPTLPTSNNSPQTRRNSSSKSTKMYNTGVNQASGFVGEIDWPLDDDCSV